MTDQLLVVKGNGKVGIFRTDYERKDDKLMKSEKIGKMFREEKYFSANERK